jgi:hypothetical protein
MTKSIRPIVSAGPIKSMECRLLRSWPVQLVAVVSYIQYLLAPECVSVAYSQNYEFAAIFAAIIAFAFKLAIMTAISTGIALLTAKKPPKPRHAPPAGIEQFSAPTAEEGRAVQVLFGKRYIEGPNVVWYGDLKSIPVVIRV